jgi:hypothetical protein
MERAQAATKGIAPALRHLAAGVDARRVSAVHGCWVWAVELVDQGPQRGKANPKTPGWREPPWGADGPQPGAGPKARKRLAHNGWAGANTTHCAQRLTKTPLRFRRSRYRTGHGDPAQAVRYTA